MSFIRKPFRYTFFNATLALVLINAIVYFINFTFPRTRLYMSLSVAGLHFKYYWQVISYMFVHGNMRHIFFNMIALVCFGLQFERAIGSKEFILFYFVCGILSGLCSVGIYWLTGTHAFLMGASAAIYALLLAYAVVFPRSIISIWGIIPVPAPLLVLIYAGIEFFSQFSGGNTAHSAHLMGLVFAWLYFVVRMGINPIKVWKDAYQR